MKAINCKLATFSFAALLLASCSDNSNDINSGSSERNTTVVGAAITSVTDAQELAARVHNYKISSTNTKTRTIDSSNSSIFEGVVNMPVEPTLPEDAIDLTTVKDKWNNMQSGKSYVLKSGTMDSQGMNVAGVTIYVCSGATLTWKSYQYQSNPTVIILSGGKVIDDQNGNLAKCCNVNNYGTVDFQQSTIEITHTFRTNKDIKVSDNQVLKVSGNLYVGGNVSAKDFQPGGGIINIKGNLDLGENNLKLCSTWNSVKNQTIGTNLNVDGKITLKDLELTNSSVLYSGCNITAKGYLNLNSGEIHVSYLKANKIQLSSGFKLILNNQSMIVTPELNVQNTQTGDNTAISLPVDNAAAVIKATSLIFQNGTPVDGKYEISFFSTSGDNSKIIIDGTLKDKQGNVATPDFKSGNVYLSSDNNASDVVIKKTDCNPEGWNDDKKDDDKKDEDKKGNLDKITVIDYDNHDHDISATGIMELNNKLYMSYHTRGDKSSTSETGHGGCVEVFTPVTENKVEMKQYLYDSALDLDFNHLLAVSQNNGKKKVYMPGSSNKKGAMLAYMDILSDGLLNTESTAITTSGEDGKSTITYNEPLQYIQMNPATGDYKGYDENCVVYNDKTDHFIVMTTKGYIIYDSDYNEVARCTPATGKGKAKHVAIGDGKIITLVLDEEVTEGTEQAIPAHVYIYDQASENLTDENPTSFSVETIQPNNGKNVIAIDNGLIYVCRGGAGMYVYDLNGTYQWHYQMPNAQILSDENGKSGNFKALANGLFVDKDYVYVAYGSHGLVVLDKTTHKVVARRAETKSANYVYVYDGFIYVAYGRDRLQVFKLYPNGIESSDTNYDTNKD